MSVDGTASPDADRSPPRPSDRVEPAGEPARDPARDHAEQALRATAARLRLLADAGRIFAGTLDEGAAVTTVVRLAVPRLGDACRVDLIDAEGRSRRAAAESAGDAPLPPGPDEDGPAALLRHRPGPVVLRRDDPNAPGAHEILDRWGAHAMVAVPLAVRGQLVGTVTLAIDARSPARGLGDDDVALVEELARRASAAIEQARLLAEARAARAEAEAANRAKSEFLATMSHELRTPLNAILGYADLLDAGIGGSIAPSQRQYVDRIRGSGHRLLGLIEDVLDFAKLEAGQLEVVHEPTVLAQTVERALALVRPIADARGVRLVVPPLPDVRYCGDDDRVRQVLVNLLTNAVKFTAAGGVVALECRIVGGSDAPGDAAGQAGGRGAELPDPSLADVPETPVPRRPAPRAGWLCAQVRDTGMGIADDQLGRVFDPFVQVDASRTRTAEGTGLGLAISRQLARRMRGELTVASRAGVGSAFGLWLGRAPEPRRITTPGVAMSRALARHLGDVMERFTQRLRLDPLVPLAPGAAQSDLENHIATLLTDLAQHFVIFDEQGVDTVALVRDGTDLQRQINEKHGQQRWRLGWDEAALRREFVVLDEVLGEVVREELAAHADRHPLTTGRGEQAELTDELLGVIRAFLGEAVAGSVVAYRAAAIAAATRTPGVSPARHSG